MAAAPRRETVRGSQHPDVPALGLGLDSAGRRTVVRTGAIVGRALNTQTPVFVEEMRYIIFRPYWNVPPSILRNEILPALERDPDYLRRQDMEIVSGPGDEAGPVTVTAESIVQLRAGNAPRPAASGPKNALGLVKFVFPNDYNVYLHGTPARSCSAGIVGISAMAVSCRGSGRVRRVGAQGATGVDPGTDPGGDEC